MRVAFTVLLALHGAIHVLGFLKWSRLATVPQLGGRTIVSFSSTGEQVFALAWLVALLLLLAASILRLVRYDSWWVPALGGVLLSQCLIVLAWQDAKLGTVANVLILVPTLIAAAHARFNERVDSEIRALFAQPSAVVGVVERAELERLPTPVRKWLDVSGVVGRERIRSVRLKQRGDLRTSPDAA